MRPIGARPAGSRANATAAAVRRPAAASGVRAAALICTSVPLARCLMAGLVAATQVLPREAIAAANCDFIDKLPEGDGGRQDPGNGTCTETGLV
jgi:hypothetical protein